MSFGDTAIFNLEGITLASHTTKDGIRIKAKVQGLGELTGGVTEETNLQSKGQL